MKKRWIDKDGNFWDGISIVIDGMRIWNPSDEQLIAVGYTEWVEPTPPEPTPEELLERAKQEKLMEIEDYDMSDSVNSFTVQLTHEGAVVQEIATWIDRETRADYKNSLDAAELLGRTEVTPVFNGVPLTLPVSLAKMALAQIQIYANQCYNVTEQHKAAVTQLQTLQEVEDFDIEADYPEKLVFELPVPNVSEE